MAKPPRALGRWYDHPAYLAIRALVTGCLVMDSDTAIRRAGAIGSWFGGSGVNRKRLGRALKNLEIAFPEWEPERRHEIAVQSYSHLLKLAVETSLAPRMLTEDAWLYHVRPQGIEAGVQALVEGRPCLLLTGHVGNWEVLGYTVALLGFPAHALYRPLDMRPLDAWVRQTRQRRGLTLVDKFGAVRKLPTLIRQGAPIAFVADQNGGDRGVMVPYFNRLTSTYKAISLLAMQFNATLICGAARRLRSDERVGLPGEPCEMRFCLEATDVIEPKDWEAEPDPIYYICARYRRAIEMTVRRSPEQYLWMHRIWRSRPRHERLGKPFPDALKEKIRSLPWTTEDDLGQIMEHSERDTRTLAETGQTRLS